jgi:hypothetical protein
MLRLLSQKFYARTKKSGSLHATLKQQQVGFFRMLTGFPL